MALVKNTALGQVVPVLGLVLMFGIGSAEAAPGAKNNIPSWEQYEELEFGFSEPVVKGRIEGRPMSYKLLLECQNKHPALRLGTSLSSLQNGNAYYQFRIDEDYQAYHLTGTANSPWEVTFRHQEEGTPPEGMMKFEYEQFIKRENTALTRLFKELDHGDYVTIRQIAVDQHERETELWHARFSLKKFDDIYRSVVDRCDQQNLGMPVFMTDE